MDVPLVTVRTLLFLFSFDLFVGGLLFSNAFVVVVVVAVCCCSTASIRDNCFS